MATCPKGHDSATADYCDVCGAPMSGGGAAAGGTAPASAAGGGGGTAVAGGGGAAGTGAAAPPETAPAGTAGPDRRCPVCGTVRTADYRFCEEDGYDFLLAPPVDPARAAASPAAATTAAPGPAAGPEPAAGAAGPAPAAAPGSAGGPEAAPGSAGGPGAAPGSAGGYAPAAGSGSTPGPAAGAAGWQVVVNADRPYFDVVRSQGGEDADELAFPPFVVERRFPLHGEQLLIGRRSRSRGVDPDIDLVGPPEDPGVSHLHALLVAQPGGWAVVDLGSANGTYLNDPSSHPIDPNTPVPVRDGDRIYLGAWTSLTVRGDA